jgi:hypothetical protein
LGAQSLLNGIEKGFIMAFRKLDTSNMKACYSGEWVFYLDVRRKMYIYAGMESKNGSTPP